MCFVVTSYVHYDQISFWEHLNQLSTLMSPGIQEKLLLNSKSASVQTEKVPRSSGMFMSSVGLSLMHTCYNLLSKSVLFLCASL